MKFGLHYKDHYNLERRGLKRREDKEENYTFDDRCERKHNLRENLEELQKEEEEKEKKQKVIEDEKRHGQNYSKMKKMRKKKSLGYNNKKKHNKRLRSLFGVENS